MRYKYFTVHYEGQQILCSLHSANVRSETYKFPAERQRGTEKYFKGHRSGSICGICKPAGFNVSQRCECRHCLGTINKRKPLLGSQCNRFQSDKVQGIRSGYDLFTRYAFALPYQRKAEMSKRGQIT